MCHFLYVASPLTLSEVRAMLPDGLAADLLTPGESALLVSMLPTARTGVRLVAGACSCDLFVERSGGIRGEEADLRRRYRSIGLSRAATITALDRHRRAGRVRHLPTRWAALLAGFVAEHARNAGPTLYLRQVSADGRVVEPAGPAATLRLHEVRDDSFDWIPEGRPTIILRDR